MDPITHCLVGGLVAKTVKAPRRRFWILIFLGEAPDLDVFFSSFGPWAFWLQHRGITHSFFGAAVQTLLYAWAFSRIDPGPLKVRLGQYFLPLFLHTCCDYLTSYGTPLFSPFSFKEYVGNLVPAVTVIPLAFMLAGLLYIHAKKTEGWRATRPLWMAWAVYLSLALASRSYAAQFVKDEPGKITLVSGLVSPVTWTAVVERDPCCAYQAFWINVLKRQRKTGPAVSTPMDSFPIQASLKSPVTRRVVASIRWPVARAVPLPEGGWRVDWGKMLFSSRGMVRSLWSVEISSAGAIGGEKRMFGFWSPNEKKS